MLEAYLADWFSVIVRWLHLITGIAWVGASLHFIWLDNSLEEPDEKDKANGVKGQLWSIHGGGIYNFSKYSLAPRSWPRVLHWSKWEAYTTWITGMLLMVAVYYLQSTTYLVGPGKWLQDAEQAVLGSVGFLASGVLVYELLIRSPFRFRKRIFAAVLIGFIVLQCWLATRLFSDRAAFLHVGAFLGTIMAANVFLGIIPTQKRFVAAVQDGQVPDAEAASLAKERSTHNNYLTLPVLFCMISNHYPFLYSHSKNWLVLACILGITAYARHFFNLRHRGVVDYRILAIAFAAFLGLALWLGYEKLPSADQPYKEEVIVIDDAAAEAILNKHCRVCHSASPTQPGFVSPPAGVLMDDPDVYLGSAPLLLTVIRTGYMPLGNVTGMTQEDKEPLITWLEEKIRIKIDR